MEKGPLYTKKKAEMQCYSMNGEVTTNRLQTFNAQEQNTVRESEGIIIFFVNKINSYHFNNSNYFNKSNYIDNLNHFDYS